MNKKQQETTNRLFTGGKVKEAIYKPLRKSTLVSNAQNKTPNQVKDRNRGG